VPLYHLTSLPPPTDDVPNAQATNFFFSKQRTEIKFSCFIAMIAVSDGASAQFCKAAAAEKCIPLSKGQGYFFQYLLHVAILLFVPFTVPVTTLLCVEFHQCADSTGQSGLCILCSFLSELIP